MTLNSAGCWALAWRSVPSLTWCAPCSEPQGRRAEVGEKPGVGVLEVREAVRVQDGADPQDLAGRAGGARVGTI